MSVQSTRLPGHLSCPQCGGRADAATGSRKPADGDIVICAYCAGINQYHIDGNSIEIIEAPDDVLEELRLQYPDIYLQIIHTQMGIKTMQKD